MSGYLSRFKALKSEMRLYEVLSKPTKPPFGSFGSDHDSRFSKNTVISSILKTEATNAKGGSIDKGVVELFPSEWLKRFDETTLERLAIMTSDGRMSDEEAQMKIIESETDVQFSWPSDIQFFIDWFLSLAPPPEPFNLEPHVHVLDPAKYFEALRREIETGPSGPRARMGTLQSDLRKLKAHFN